MAWINPRLNWTPPDGVGSADLNRIEGNIADLHTRLTSTSTTATNAMSKANTLETTRVPTRVNQGKFEYSDGGVFKQIETLPKGAISHYVNSTTGNDALTVGTLDAPLRTIGRALELLPKVSSYNRQIIITGPGFYDESIQVQDLIGGRFGISVFVSSGQVQIRCVNFTNNYGVQLSLRGGFDSPMKLGTAGQVFPLTAIDNPGCHLSLNGVDSYAYTSTAYNFSHTNTVTMDKCRVGSIDGGKLMYGITVAHTTLIGYGVSAITAIPGTVIETGIAATACIVYFKPAFGTTRKEWPQAGAQFLG